MALPTPDWNGVELRWRGRLLDGTPAQGKLIVTADVSRFLDDDSEQATSIFGVPIIVPILANGTASIIVPATDDTDVVPQNFTYTIREELLRGAGGVITINAPLSAQPDGIDLNRVVQVGVSSGTPVSPVTRAEFEALSYRFVRWDQIAVGLDTDGVPYWTDNSDYENAYPVVLDTDGVPCIEVPE